MKLSRRSFFTAAAVGAFAGLAAAKLAKPRQQTKPRTTGRYEPSAHARKYYRTAKI
jgi:anaerobic selenocysteine-containing dehydrogenase